MLAMFLSIFTRLEMLWYRIWMSIFIIPQNLNDSNKKFFRKMLRAERGFRVAFREWQAKMKSWNECFSPLKIKKQIRKEQKKKGGRKKESREENKKFWRGRGQTELLHTVGRMSNGSLWKAIQQFLKKLELPYCQEITLLRDSCDFLLYFSFMSF